MRPEYKGGLKDLIGKTITKAEFRKYLKKYDDVPYLDLTFSDGSTITIEATFGGYTGKSADEYPSWIKVGSEYSYSAFRKR